MIFRRSLVSELANTAGGVFTVIFSIVLTVGLVRILGQAAGGQIDNAAVFEIVVYTSFTYLPALIALTLFIATLMSLSRSWLDSEMVVWFSSGQSLLAWVPPVLRFALPVAAVVAGLSLVASPWSKQQIELNKQRYAQRDDVSKVSPGRFIETRNGLRVFFVENVDEAGNEVKNVFVNQRNAKGEENVVVGARGVIEVMPNGDRFLVLEDGRRYEGMPGKPEYRVLEFKRYAVRIDSKPDAPLEAQRAGSKPLQALIDERTPPHLGELMWRLAWPIACLNLVLLAVPLSYTNPRAGRSLNLIVAVLVFVLYLNAISISQAWIQQGRLRFEIGVWAVHAAVFALAVLLFVRRGWLQRWAPAWLSLGYWQARARS
jgi:lipopolysaccharide export system permease protein